MTRESLDTFVIHYLPRTCDEYGLFGNEDIINRIIGHNAHLFQLSSSG